MTFTIYGCILTADIAQCKKGHPVMDRKYLYRIEHVITGLGPYWTGGINILSRHNDSQHPNMYIDTQAPQSMNLHCGFLTIEQFMEWFELDVLTSINEFGGFLVMIYDITGADYYEGKKQTVFNKCQAIYVDRMTLDDIMQLY